LPKPKPRPSAVAIHSGRRSAAPLVYPEFLEIKEFCNFYLIARHDPETMVGMLPKQWLAAALFALLFVAAIFGQRFGRFRFNSEDNEPPGTEFIFARWEYQTPSGGWFHDYPDAEEHINQIMKEATGINVDRLSYRIVPIVSKEIFKYPFGYISEPGMMQLTDTEVKNFREFVDRGGFVMIDDFDGPRQFTVMRQNIERVFPDREMFQLTDNHGILNTYYKIDSLYVESPYQVGGRAIFYGINNEKGDLAVVICFNNDIGDFWEWIDSRTYAVKPSAEALKLGINFILYAMTH